MYIYIHIYIQLNCFAVSQNATQHCKSTILQLKKKKRVPSVYPWLPFFTFCLMVCHFVNKSQRALSQNPHGGTHDS